MERKADDMSSFALDLMPSFVERVNGPEDFTKVKNKAKKFGLPMMLVFANDRRILNEMKFLSTEFRRRVLIAQIPFSKKENKNLFFEYGVRGQALIAVPPSETVEGEQGDLEDSNQRPKEFVYDGKWSLHRLQSFFAEHALATEVKPKPTEKAKAEEKGEKEQSEKKDRVKTEL
mmetsp:Transcript_20881/g.33943  ORF Transcript_20881/g.33943 Transcript_20881/m.33943 type:complete len:174 (-) Transcript_20881:275-796(-)